MAPMNWHNLTVTEYVDTKLVSTDYNSTTIEIPSNVNQFRILEQSLFDLKVTYTDNFSLSSFVITVIAPITNIILATQTRKSTSVVIDTLSMFLSVLFLSILKSRKK